MKTTIVWKVRVPLSRLAGGGQLAPRRCRAGSRLLLRQSLRLLLASLRLLLVKPSLVQKVAPDRAPLPEHEWKPLPELPWRY